jgi:hypothetical protein
MDVKKSQGDVVMNYTYEIVLNDPDGIVNEGTYLKL